MRGWFVAAVGALAVTAPAGASADATTAAIYAELGLPVPTTLPAALAPLLPITLLPEEMTDADAGAHPDKYPVREAVRDAVKVLAEARKPKMLVEVTDGKPVVKATLPMINP